MTLFSEGQLVITKQDHVALYLADRSNGGFKFPTTGPVEYVDLATTIGFARGISIQRDDDNIYELVFDWSPNRGRYVWVDQSALVATQGYQKGAVTVPSGTAPGTSLSQDWSSQYGTLLIAGGAMLLILIVVLVMKRD